MLTVVDSTVTLLIVVITIFASLRILSRWFNLGLVGMGESAQILVLWVIFLHLGQAALERRHIRSDWLLERLSGRVETVARRLILLVNVGTVAVIFLSSWLVAQDALGRTTSTQGLPLIVKDGSLFVGMALMLAVYLYRMREELLPGGTDA